MLISLIELPSACERATLSLLLGPYNTRLQCSNQDPKWLILKVYRLVLIDCAKRNADTAISRQLSAATTNKRYLTADQNCEARIEHGVKRPESKPQIHADYRRRSILHGKAHSAKQERQWAGSSRQQMRDL